MRRYRPCLLTECWRAVSLPTFFSAGSYCEHAGLTECGTVDSAFRSNQRIDDFAWTTSRIN